MCLYISDEKGTYRLKRRMTSGKKIFYKVLSVHNGKMVSPVYRQPYRYGINESDRQSIEINTYQIEKGIHVFIEKKYAESYRSYTCREKGKVFKVKCYAGDLVAANNNHAVFMNVELF